MKDLIYAVDFDGTLCVSEWPGIGAPNLPLIEHLIERQREGVRLILWTCRVNERLQEAVDWCKQYGLEFDAINDNLSDQVELYGNNARKVHADVYFEDKAVDKAKFNIPFHMVHEKYTLGSRWWYSDVETPFSTEERAIFPCHIEAITKSCSSGEEITVVSDDKTGKFQYFSVRRETSFFNGRLFHTLKEAQRGKKDDETKGELGR